jgi:hypothetical protein
MRFHMIFWQLGKMDGRTAGATTEEMLMQQVATQLTASFYRTALTLANDEHDCVCELAPVTLTHAQYRNCAQCGRDVHHSQPSTTHPATRVHSA